MGFFLFTRDVNNVQLLKLLTIAFRFIPSNDQLEVNHKLQEENKFLRRQLQQKEELLITKERALTDIKAEMLEMKTSFLEKCRQMEAMSTSDIDRQKVSWLSPFVALLFIGQTVTCSKLQFKWTYLLSAIRF